MEFQSQLHNPPSPCIYYYSTAPNSPPAPYGRWNAMDLHCNLSAPVTPPREMDDGDEEFEFGQWKTMSLGERLFVDGMVMPLKPPPRLHGGSNCNSPVPSPPNGSPRSRFNLPFVQKSSWNDDFDPFMVALDKVRNEKREREAENVAVVNSKDSVYARWFRERVSPKCRKRGICLKAEMEKPKLSEGKMRKLKGLLFKYATFGRGSNSRATRKDPGGVERVRYW